MKKTIIVGAGINGLFLGSMLNKDGDQVVVFEKNAEIGGRAMLKKIDGYVIDNGLHVTRLGPESPVAKIMEYINKPVEFKSLGDSYLIDHDGRQVLFPTSVLGIVKTGLFDLKEKFKIAFLISKIKKGAFNHLMDLSLEEWMARYKINGGVRRYFEMVSAALMVCPFVEKVSAGELFRNVAKILNCGHAAEYLAEGWAPVYDDITESIKENGAIYTKSRVDEILLENGTAKGVRVGGRDHLADRVVLNLPVQQIFEILPEQAFDQSYVNLCKNLVPTSGVFIDIAVKGRIYDFDGMIYSYRPKTLGMITSNVAKGIAPVNGQVITMWYPTTLDDVTDPGRRRERLDELWGVIRKFFSKIDNHIYWKREKSLKMVDGAQINVSQTEDKRPGPVVPGIRNLFLVGDSVAAPGGGGDVGNESVLITHKKMTGNVSAKPPSSNQ